MAKFYKFAGKSPKFKEYKFKPQKVPRQTSAFDDALKKTRVDRIRSTFGESMPKSFYERPPVLSIAKERAEKVGRRVESSALDRIKKIRQATAKRVKARRTEFGAKKTQFFKRTNKGLARTKFEKKVKAKMTELQTTAFKLAEKRGKKAQAIMEQKLGIVVTKPRDRLKTSYQKFTPMTTRDKISKRQRRSDQGFDPDKTFSFDPFFRKTLKRKK
jgi:hypothetical protein